MSTSVTFEYLADKPGDVVTVESGTVYFEGCRFRGGKRGENAALGSGLSLRVSSSGITCGCHFAQNQLSGLSVWGGADATVEDSVCEYHGICGLAYREASRGMARNVRACANRLFIFIISFAVRHLKNQAMLQCRPC